MRVGREGVMAGDGCYFLGLHCAKFHFQDVYFAESAALLGTRDAWLPVGCLLAGLGGVLLGRVMQDQPVSE